MVMLRSPSEGKNWVWEVSLWEVPLAKGEEREEQVTISANLSTDDLGFSSKERLGNNRLGLLSCVMFLISAEQQGEGLTVWKIPTSLSLFISLGTISRKGDLSSSAFEGWANETSIGWSIRCTSAVLVSLVEIMAVKSFVLGVSKSCSEHASIFAGFICNAKSWACNDSIESWAVGKHSRLSVAEDGGASEEVTCVLVAGFVSVGEMRRRLQPTYCSLAGVSVADACWH